MRSPRAPFALAGALLVSAVCVSLACGPGGSTDAPDSAEEAAAPHSTPADSRSTPVEITSARQTASGDAFYPIPIEVTTCLDLAAAGRAEAARAACEEARRIDPGNRDVRAALLELDTEDN